MTTMHFDWGRLIRLSASRFEIVADTQNAIRLWAGLTKAATRSGAPVWDSLAIAEGIPTISPATQDMFVPQMANFELIGGVNFKKGCYPGQEIVARTQYRGILKRRMVHVHSLSSSAPRPGDPVYGKEFGDQPAGMIVNVAPAADCGFDALVVAQIDSIKSGSLSLATTGDNPLTLRSLPYAIPELL